jgi:nucleobase:cation symporter-1, NCS1 family
LGVTIPRYKAVSLDAVLGTGMTVYAVFFSNFLTALGEFLQLMIVWYAPYTAIFIVDWYLRKYRYDGHELHDRNGRYWYDRGVSWRGMAALLTGMAATFFCANTTHWQSPISKSLGGADISALIGLVVGGGMYWLLMRHRVAERTEAVQPVPSVTDAG